MTNIIVAFRKSDDAKNIRNLLVRSGFSVMAVCTTGAQVLAQADGLTDGIVVCGYQMTDMLYSGIRESLPAGFELLLLAGKAVLPGFREEGVLCLSMPLKAQELVDSLAMLDRNLSMRRRRRRSQPRKRSEAEEKLLKQAKSLLMDRNHMSEEEAHRYLQKCSMDSGNSICETAQMVLTVYR